MDGALHPQVDRPVDGGGLRQTGEARAGEGPARAQPRGPRPRAGVPASLGADLLQRLRTAGLRVTMARLGVLQVLEASSRRLAAEEVFQQLELRGIQVSLGTTYRVIREFEMRGLVLCEWDRQRKARFRIKPIGQDLPTLRLVCSGSGRSFALADADLYARLVAVVSRAGLQITDSPALSIHVDGPDCTPVSRNRSPRRPR